MLDIAKENNQTPEAFKASEASWGIDDLNRDKVSPEKLEELRVTPQSVLREAALANSNEQLADMAKHFEDKKPLDTEMRDFVDGVMAALQVSDTGEVMDNLDADRWRDVKEWLAGDEAMTAIIENKRDALRFSETKLAMGEAAVAQEWATSEYGHDVEPVALSEIAIVRSADHPFVRDENGNVVIHPASYYRDDVVRQTVHFTLNHQVASHGEGSWGNDDNLVVANMQRAVDANGLPGSMKAVDSWWTVDPNQSISLPDATVVMSDHEGDGQLIQNKEEASEIVYKSIPDEGYTNEERQQVQQLLREFGLDAQGETSSIAEQLREVALRMAMRRSGVSDFGMMPTGGAHGTSSESFDARIMKTASEMGLGSGAHFVSRFTRSVHSLNPEIGFLGSGLDPFDHKTGKQRIDPGLPLAMKRQMFVSGNVVSENLPEDLREVPDTYNDLEMNF